MAGLPSKLTTTNPRGLLPSLTMRSALLVALLVAVACVAAQASLRADRGLQTGTTRSTLRMLTLLTRTA